MDYSFHFPVVRGIQAGREYYIGMVPVKMLDRIIPDDTELLPPEYRSQRRINTARIPGMRQYILDNRESYVFSALAVSIDGDFHYTQSSDAENVGILDVAMDAKFLINDGQHRKAALLEAMIEDESLKDETISVVFYEDQGLSRSQQMFTDFNKYAVKTSNSLSVLYDSRDPLAVATRHVISKIDFLDEYTDKETDNLGTLSHCFFTLNTFYKANRQIYKQSVPEDCESFLYAYWSTVTENMPLWSSVKNKEILVGSLKTNYIVTQGIVIQSLGRLGAVFLDRRGDMKEILRGLTDLDWRRSASIWRGRAVRDDGHIIANSRAVILICNAIKKKLGIKLTPDEQEEEKRLKTEGK